MDWVFLTRLLQKAPATPGFLYKNFAKNKEFSPIPKVRLVTSKTNVTIAKLGKLYDPPHAIKGEAGVNEVYLEPAQIFEYDDITEELLFAENMNPKVLAINNASDVVKSKDIVYATKLKILKQRVYNRIEWMMAQMLSTGKIDYAERNISYIFKSSADGTIDFTDPIVTQFRDIVAEIAGKGYTVDYILLSHDVARDFIDNSETKEFLSRNVYGLGERVVDTAPFAYKVATIPGLPPIYVYNGNIGGTSLFASGKIVFVSTEAIGVSFGAIINANVDKNMNPVQAEMVSWEKVSEHGNTKQLYVLSRPLPYIIDNDGVRIYNKA